MILFTRRRTFSRFRPAASLALRRRSWPERVALAAIVALGAAPAFSTTLIDLSVERSIASSGESFCPGCGPNGEDDGFANSFSEESTDLGLFDASVSSVGGGASQTSTIDSSGILFEGSIDGGLASISNSSMRLDADFRVATASAWQLEGVFSGDTGSLVLVELGGGPLLANLFRRSPADLAFDEIFLLSPGVDYQLRYDASTDFSSGKATWRFVPVPEPGTALLMGLGLGGMAMLRSSRLPARQASTKRSG